MVDIFAEAGSGPAERPPAALNDAEVVRLAHVLDRAVLLGAEVDTRYRVLALTVELDEADDPFGPREDTRVQLLGSPVSTILVSLIRTPDGSTPQLLTFDTWQLVDVVVALDRPMLGVDPFVGSEPRPGEWGPRFSLEGRSTAPNGTARRLRLELEAGEVWFGLFARFDHLEVRDAAGTPLRLDEEAGEDG